MKNFTIGELDPGAVYTVELEEKFNRNRETLTMTGAELRTLTETAYRLYENIKAEKKVIYPSSVKEVEGRKDWMEVWKNHMDTELSEMVKAMAADLAAGCDYFGSLIESQREEIERFKKYYDSSMANYQKMSPNRANAACCRRMQSIGKTA